MSKLNEMLSRPATHVLTTRIDGRYLATLARFWHDQGEIARSSSELLRLSLEGMVELLVSNQLVEFVETHKDALDVLDRLGLKTKTANRTNLAQQLAGEDLKLSSLSTFQDPFHAPRVTRASKGRRADDDPALQVARAELERRLLEQSAEDTSERASHAKERTTEFKKVMLDQVKDALTNSKEGPQDDKPQDDHP